MSTEIALATEDDILVAVSASDLRSLLEIARVQVESCDPDELAAYGLADGEEDHLFGVANTLLDAIPHALRCRRCGGDAHLNGSGFPTHGIPSKDADHAPDVTL